MIRLVTSFNLGEQEHSFNDLHLTFDDNGLALLSYSDECVCKESTHKYIQPRYTNIPFLNVPLCTPPHPPLLPYQSKTEEKGFT